MGVGPWWPPERAHVESGYRDLSFPWPELDFPPQEMTAEWTLPQLLGHQAHKHLAWLGGRILVGQRHKRQVDLARVGGDAGP